MRTGLLLGKFMPLHNGHLALIRYAAAHCDRLRVWLCVSPAEPIPGDERRAWLEAALENIAHAELVYTEYDERELPNTSVSDRAVSAKWAAFARRLWPDFSGPDAVVFSSEPYGAYLAEALSATHETFDPERREVPISATKIREHPFAHWPAMPSWVRLFFVDSTCLVGTESTGKTTLTRLLAESCDAPWVSEAGRDVVAHSDRCEWEDLPRVAEAHAQRILDALVTPCRRLFVDTDLTITQSYAEFLFRKPLVVTARVRAANRFKRYLYCEADAPYVQDGTRLDQVARHRLDQHHRQRFQRAGISFFPIGGADWGAREVEAKRIVAIHHQDAKSLSQKRPRRSPSPKPRKDKDDRP